MNPYYCSGLIEVGRREGQTCRKLLFKYAPPVRVETKCPRCNTLNWLEVKCEKT